MIQYSDVLTKENIDEILLYFAKQYRKCCGDNPAEIVVVGGGSILLNYDFRDSTMNYQLP